MDAKSPSAMSAAPVANGVATGSMKRFNRSNSLQDKAPAAARHMRQLRPGLTCHFGRKCKKEICYLRNKMRVQLVIHNQCIMHMKAWAEDGFQSWCGQNII